jgi:hypothetical protein
VLISFGLRDVLGIDNAFESFTNSDKGGKGAKFDMQNLVKLPIGSTYNVMEIDHYGHEKPVCCNTGRRENKLCLQEVCRM